MHIIIKNIAFQKGWTWTVGFIDRNKSAECPQMIFDFQTKAAESHTEGKIDWVIDKNETKQSKLNNK